MIVVFSAPRDGGGWFGARAGSGAENLPRARRQREDAAVIVHAHAAGRDRHVQHPNGLATAGGSSCPLVFRELDGETRSQHGNRPDPAADREGPDARVHVTGQGSLLKPDFFGVFLPFDPQRRIRFQPDFAISAQREGGRLLRRDQDRTPAHVRSADEFIRTRRLRRRVAAARDPPPRQHAHHKPGSDRGKPQPGAAFALQGPPQDPLGHIRDPFGPDFLAEEDMNESLGLAAHGQSVPWSARRFSTQLARVALIRRSRDLIPSSDIPRNCAISPRDFSSR